MIQRLLQWPCYEATGTFSTISYESIRLQSLEFISAKSGTAHYKVTTKSHQRIISYDQNGIPYVEDDQSCMVFVDTIWKQGQEFDVKVISEQCQ